MHHRAAARISEHRRHLAEHGLCAVPRRLSQEQRVAKRARDQVVTCANLQKRKEAKQAQEPKAKQAQEPNPKQPQSSERAAPSVQPQSSARAAPSVQSPPDTLTLADFIHPYKRGRGQTGPRGM